MIFDHFDTIRIVNLSHRTDRRAEMVRELRKVGLDQDPRVEFFKAHQYEEPANFYSSGARGAYGSQLALLKEAADQGQSLLILEDDCDFTPTALTYTLPEDWQIFYGGYLATSDPANPHASDIVGAHFMGFRADVVGPIAAYLQKILDSGHYPPIDGAYVWYRRAHPECVSIFSDPVLGVQRPSRTDIGEQRFFDRMPGLKTVASFARKMKGVHRPS